MSNNELRFWIWLFVVLFVFNGEPDVWDKLHDYVMHMEVCK
jgi:hypothetical protein